MEITRWHGIPKSTLFTILKMREEIVNAVQKEGHDVKAKNLKGATHANLKQAMLEWFSQHWAQNVPINGPMMQKKVDEFSLRLDRDLFLSLFVLSSRKLAPVMNHQCCDRAMTSSGKSIATYKGYESSGKPHYHIEGECCDITRNDEDRSDLSYRTTKLVPVKEIAGSLLKHIVASETMLEPALNSHQAWATPHSKGWRTFQRAECRAKPDRCDKRNSQAMGLRVSTLECVFSQCNGRKKTGVRRRQTDITPTVSTTPPINKTPFVDNRQPTVYRPTGGSKRPSQENERHPVSTRRPTNNNYNEPQITSTRSRPQEEFEWITEQPLSIQRYSDATLDPLPSINTPSPPLKEYRPREPMPNDSWKTTPRSPSTRRPQDTRPETDLRPTDVTFNNSMASVTLPATSHEMSALLVSAGGCRTNLFQWSFSVECEQLSMARCHKTPFTLPLTPPPLLVCQISRAFAMHGNMDSTLISLSE
uniref:Uncharacterized protein n=1 Tax=Timema tahoe TaxID=61484 RepID=A0A7R9IHK1_9NEOP|nr:unnamed protein product [Timema tahoe]